jgi:ATP-binding cassette subfamily F protein 3
VILATLDRVLKSYGKEPLLREISLVVKSGDRIGLVGRNGAGKTTLLEILRGLQEPDSGSVSLPKEIKTAYLKQESTLRESRTLYQEMEVPFSDLISLEARIEAVEKKLASAPDDRKLHREYESLLERREGWGDCSYESKIKLVTRGLGFSEEDLSKEIRSLSGGEKNRAALAQILLTDAQLLLLDEPTNHLDISGREFLEDFLLSFKGGAVIVSHDRYLLTRVATHIAELHAATLDLYHGSYEEYLPQREENLERKKKLYEEQREFIRRQEDFIRRNIAGQKTKQAQSRRRMLEKLERVQRPTDSGAPMRLQPSETARLPRRVVELTDLAKSVGGTLLFREVTQLFERDDKIGLIGPNGCGKTTLLNLILQMESPDGGETRVGKNVVVGYYPQEVRFSDPSQTLLDYLWKQVPDWTSGEVRTYLGRFLFSGEEVERPLKSFSGGEQSKAVLARLLLKNANFLILDEPTNHLDIPSTEVLESFLADFQGTVLAVSHDRFFLDKFANKILAFEGTSVREHLGNYSDYLAKRAMEESRVSEVMSVARRDPFEKKDGHQDKKRERPDRPKRRRGTFKVQQIEKQIEALESNLQEIEETMESETHSTDWAKLTSLTKERSELETQLEELYRIWEEAAE